MRRLVKLAMFLVTLSGMIAQADAATLLRDPDIENSLRKLATPVLLAAGLSPARVKILVVDDRNLNAFVIDSNHIFIHSGLLLKLSTASEVQAVIAHEAAHIANGHIARRTLNARAAKNLAGIGLALAAAAAASGNGDAATTLGIGIASSANRVFMGHTRAEESSADQSAVRYLARAGADPFGAVSVMDIFAGQELVSAARQDPYARTHPMSRDRLRHVRALASSYIGASNLDTSKADYWFSRAKGKLSAFLRAPKWTRQRASDSASKDIELMRLAISYHLDSNTAKALATMAQLISTQPRDAFYRELHGQVLLESGNTAAAVAAYRKAVELAPDDALILGSYGRALLVSGQSRNALRYLEKSRSNDSNNTRVMRDLAQAYAQAGQGGMAALITSERYAFQGRIKDAGIHAKRAADLLPRGTAGWQRAQDVLSTAQASAKKRR